MVHDEGTYVMVDDARQDGLLDPTTRALAGLVLAVVGLTGSHSVAQGVLSLTEGLFGGASGTHVLRAAVATAVLPGLAAWLASAPSREVAGGG